MPQLDPYILPVLFIAVALAFFAIGQQYELRRQMKDADHSSTEPWHWLAKEFVQLGVRAASQMFDDVEKRYPYVEQYVIDSLWKNYKIAIPQADRERLRVLIEAAWAEFKQQVKPR